MKDNTVQDLNMNKPEETFQMSYHLHRPWADILFQTILLTTENKSNPLLLVL